MDPKELKGLMEAYSEVYAPIDEAVKGESPERRSDLAAQRRAGDKPLSPAKGRDNANKMQRDINYFDKLTKKNNNEEVEIFDTVLEFLYVEGYAETLEEAEWLMANVIDEEAIDIITELTGGKGHPGYKAGSKDRGPMQSGHSADSEKRKDKGGTMSQRHGYHLGDIDDNDDDEDGLETIVKQQSRDSRANVRKPLRNKVQAARKVLSKEQYVDEGKLPLDKERRTKIGNQIGKRLQSSGSEIIGSGSAFMPKGIRNNLRQSAAKKVGEVKKMMGVLKSAQKEEYMDEAQEARNNPEKYEAGQQKKSAPVRGERTPMPPRGDKRREDFEKWYAANVR